MSRMIQNRADRGSQKWLQVLVNECPELIDRVLATQLGLTESHTVRWLSPLKEDGYTEYRDHDFLSTLGISLDRRSLASFWPKNGPRWDALANTDRGDVILVEAKAHIPELVTDPTQASKPSLKRICKSLNDTKRHIGSHSDADWATCFYQYTNRLAHLYLLRELNGISAYLVLLYFINDEEMNGPSSQVEWEGAIKLLESFLGIRQSHSLSEYILHVFLDVVELEGADT